MRLMNQVVDPFNHAFVLLLPVEVVFPCLIGKNQLHFASSRSVPLPTFSWATADRSRLALAGVRNR